MTADNQNIDIYSEINLLIAKSKNVSGVNLILSTISVDDIRTVQQICNYINQQIDSVITVLGTVINNTPIIVTSITEDLVRCGFHAGNISRDLAKLMGGGSGGGKPALAYASGHNPDMLDNAINSMPNIIRNTVLVK